MLLLAGQPTQEASGFGLPVVFGEAQAQKLIPKFRFIMKIPLKLKGFPFFDP